MNIIKRTSSTQASPPKVQGFVKWFNNDKGYGFLTPEYASVGLPTDIFVHYSAIQMDGHKKLIEGQRVAFDLETGPKGPQALNVKAL